MVGELQEAPSPPRSESGSSIAEQACDHGEGSTKENTAERGKVTITYLVHHCYSLVGLATRTICIE